MHNVENKEMNIMSERYKLVNQSALGLSTVWGVFFLKLIKSSKPKKLSFVSYKIKLSHCYNSRSTQMILILSLVNNLRWMKEHPLNQRALLWTTRPPWWSSQKPSPSLHRKWWVSPLLGHVSSRFLIYSNRTDVLQRRERVLVDESCPPCDRWLSQWPALKSSVALPLRWLWTTCSWPTKDASLQPLQSQRRWVRVCQYIIFALFFL